LDSRLDMISAQKASRLTRGKTAIDIARTQPCGCGSCSCAAAPAPDAERHRNNRNCTRDRRSMAIPLSRRTNGPGD